MSKTLTKEQEQPFIRERGMYAQRDVIIAHESGSRAICGNGHGWRIGHCQ
jgi:hypothetical protein